MTVGVIYQIYYNEDKSINYIGSTMNEDLKIRWKDHMSDYDKYLKNPKNKRSVIYDYFKEYGVKNFKIIKLKEINIVDNKHLKAYEQLYINKYKPVNKVHPLNMLIKVKNRNYQKKHYIKNKERIKEYCKQRYKNNKEYFDKYAEINKEKIKEYKKQYYQKQKANNTEQYQKLVNKPREKVNCNICNKLIAKDHINEHLRTQIHKDNANNIDYSKDPNKKLCHICNCYITKRHFKEHERSKKHQENLNKK